MCRPHRAEPDVQQDVAVGRERPSDVHGLRPYRVAQRPVPRVAVLRMQDSIGLVVPLTPPTMPDRLRSRSATLARPPPANSDGRTRSPRSRPPPGRPLRSPGELIRIAPPATP